MKTLEEIKMDAIIERLIYFNGHRQRAADSLGLSIRTIRNFINKLRYDEPDLARKIPYFSDSQINETLTSSYEKNSIN